MLIIKQQDKTLNMLHTRIIDDDSELTSSYRIVTGLTSSNITVTVLTSSNIIVTVLTSSNRTVIGGQLCKWRSSH